MFINNEEVFNYKRNENYLISKTGKIYSLYKKGGQGSIDPLNPREIKYTTDKDGYLKVVLIIEGERKDLRVNRIVAEQFIGIIPDNYVVNHIDGNKQNNSINNLEIITSKENTLHAHQNGLTSTEKPLLVKYNNRWIKFRSIKECCDYFPNLSSHYIKDVLNNNIKFSNCVFKIINPNLRISPVEVYFNHRLVGKFKNMKEACKYFNKSYSSIKEILNGQYRKEINKYEIKFLNVSTIENTVEI